MTSCSSWLSAECNKHEFGCKGNVTMGSYSVRLLLGVREVQSVQYLTQTGSLLLLQGVVSAQLKPWGMMATRLLWPWLLAALMARGVTSTPATCGEVRPAR